MKPFLNRGLIAFEFSYLKKNSNWGLQSFSFEFNHLTEMSQIEIFLGNLTFESLEGLLRKELELAEIQEICVKKC